MESQIVNEGGQVRMITGRKGVNLFACRAVALGIKMYLESDGRMMANRSYTPKNMRAYATAQTGKNYPRSRAGLVLAFEDLNAILRDPASFEGIEIINR